MPLKRPITFQDVCDITVVLLKKYKIQFDKEHLYSRISVIGHDNFLLYIGDIGVVVSKDAFGVTSTITSINDDKKWAKAKLQIFLNHIDKL